MELSSILENRFHTRSELVSFPFKFPVWKLPIWNPSSPVLNWSACNLEAFLCICSLWVLKGACAPILVWNCPLSSILENRFHTRSELVSFPFKFPAWKLPIWNPSSPVLNWSAFLSSSLCGSWSAFLSDSFCGSFQFGSFFVYMFSQCS